MAYIIRHEADYDAEGGFRNNDNVMCYRRKAIKSGDILEIEIYPVYRSKNAPELKKLPSKEKYRRYNAKQSAKMCQRLINANFGPQDLHVTCTYSGTELPEQEQCEKDMQNFIRRINRRRQKEGLAPARYMYVIEGKTDEDKRTRVHSHLILEGGLDRDTIEALWRAGSQKGAPRGTCNADRLQPGDMQLTALAAYLMKDPKGRKRWKPSKNLKKPEVYISDTAIKRKHVAQLARGAVNPIDYWRKQYPGYVFRDMQIKTNQCLSGAAVIVQLQRRC